MAAVLVHGGAGAWLRWPGQLPHAVAACEAAAAAGRDALASGGSALDAVEAAVRVLEDAPMLNAGRGSLRNTDGIVEMDALIMDGATLDLGAVAAVTRLRHPVSLARRLMTDTPHALLVGEGAARFADAIGLPGCTNDELIVARDAPAAASDTVGAVAIDDAGNVAAATSTGGVPNKMPGRVGDSPIAGAGGYADNATGAVSATGDGEAFMKLLISKHVCDLIAAGAAPQSACEEAIRLVVGRLDAHGGLIALDRMGRPAVAFNTEAMPWAYATSKGPTASGHAPDSFGEATVA